MPKLQTYIERPNSVITGKPVELIHTIKDFPVFFGCVDHPREDDLFADMHWGIDTDCGAIQLTRLIPLEILYKEQHVDGTGQTWSRYYDDFADYIVDVDPRCVLEIGGGSGELANRVAQRARAIDWTIVEPNPIITETEQIHVVKSFFDSDLKLDKPFDTVVFSQVMEHAYDPKDFVRQISEFLPPGGKVIFAYPQTASWLGKMFTNSINFEHTFLIDDFIEYIFEAEGFRINSKQTYNDHSLFFIATKEENVISSRKLPNRYQSYKSLYMRFIEYHEQLVKELNQLILDSQEPVYLFGAHIFATYLFSIGLNPNIAGILDNSKLKQGRRLYGTDHIVKSPEILKQYERVNVILKAGVYNSEIRDDIVRNINSRVVFW